MSIDRLRAHFGFSKTPFSKELAPGMLHQHHGHAEAVARICWCIQESGLGMISGEVGSGKTGRAPGRRRDTGPDPAHRHLPRLPGCRRPWDLRQIVQALGGTPCFHYASLIPVAQASLAAERDERGRRVIVIVDEAHLVNDVRAGGAADADQRRGECRRNRVRAHE